MIFIVGNSRSGTTMMGRMLGAHSKVHTFEELHFFEQMIDATAVQHPTQWPRSKLEAMLERLLTSANANIFTKVTPGQFSAEAAQILQAANTNDPVSVYSVLLQKITEDQGKEIPCEQTPRYLFMTDELLVRFPEARFVCMVRDPRAVLLSQKKRWKVSAKNMTVFWKFLGWLNYHPYSSSLVWTAANRKARQYAESPRFHTVQFETLAQSPETTIRAICDFLDIPFEPQMLDVSLIGSSSGENRPQQRGVDASRIDSWRKGGLSDGEIALCDRVAGAEMKKWGYDPTGLKISRARRALFMLGFVIKTGTAILVNLPRNKNLIQSIRRRLS